MTEAASPRAVKRATSDYRALSKAASGTTLEQSGAAFISVALSDQTGSRGVAEDAADVFHWLVTVTPPAQSVYAGRSYDLLLVLSPVNFPFSAPLVVVKTPMFNPIVSPQSHQLCEALLQNDSWQPTIPPLALLDRICDAVFVKYGELDFLNEEAAKLYNEDKVEFAKRVAAVRDEA